MIDETDEKILRELLRNSQQSHRKIAKRIGVSLGTVVSRKRRMEKDGVIKAYVAQLDYEKLGYDLIVIVEVTVSHGKVIDICKEIAKFQGASSVYNITGGSDIMLFGRFKSKKEVGDFTKRILEIRNVERTNTHLVLNIFKEDFSSL